MRPPGIRHALLAVVALLALWAPPAGAVTVQTVTGGGVEAWLVEERSTPIINVHVTFLGGAATDPDGLAGRASMVAALLSEGAGDLDAQAFQRRLQELAVHFGMEASIDSVDVAMRTLTRHRDAAFALLRSVLTEPRFDADAVERVRAEVQASLRQRAENPDVRAAEALMAALFPDHPYGRPVDGTAESIAGITVDDLRAFARDRLTRDSLLIGVVGDISAEELSQVLAATFGALPESGRPVAVPDVLPATDGGLMLIDEAVPQSAIAFAQPGLHRTDPDWYAAVVMNHILGGGTFTSRLFREVREVRGLAYGVGTQLEPMAHAAIVRGGAGTANERVAETVRVIRDEWARMAEFGVTEAEVAAAKTFLTGSFALRFTSSPRIARMLVGMQLYDLGTDYVDRYAALVGATTTADVNRVVGRIIRPDALRIVVVGQPQGLAPAN